VKRGPYLPWRHRAVAQRLRETWLTAAQLAREPIVYTATDENTPAGVPASDGKTFSPTDADDAEPGRA
jgi:hypothetical protein